MANKANNKATASRDSYKKGDHDTLPDDFDGRLVYERMIEVFFFFKPIEDLNETVHENFMGYGSAAHEFFKNHAQLMGMARMQADQLRDQEYTLTRKPVAAKLLGTGDSCLIIEEFELYMHKNEHRLSLRLSAILERMNGKWLISHFHGSTPDSNIAEEEAFPMEGLRRKNRELEEKIRERTRELEIEAALERVRTRTMTMHKSEELKKVVAEMYRQLDALDFSRIGCELILCDKEKDQLQFWSSSIKQSQLPERYDIPRSIHPFFKKIWNTWKQKQPHLTITLEGKEKRDFDKLIFSKTDFRKFPATVKKYIRSRKSDVFTFATMKYGVLEAVDDEALSEDKIKILERFAKVFEQTYTRFLDLQKSEAQAREAEIQLALERVRARTMAMHKSDELAEVVAILYEQIQNLGFTDWGCSIIICDQEAQVMRYWYSEINLTLLPDYCNVPLANKTVKKIWKLWQSGIPQFDISLLGKAKEDFTFFMLNDTDYHDILPEDVKEGWIKPKDIFLSYFTFKYGLLEFVDIKPLDKANYPTYQRFANVFEQTYTRFLDLQKAEAQAREAQVEAGLERVRASAMAMHNSKELTNVANVLHKEFINLGLSQSDTSAFVIVDEPGKAQHYYGTSAGKNFLEYLELPLSGDNILKIRYDAWKRKDSLCHQVVGGKKLQKHLSVVAPDDTLSEVEKRSKLEMPDPTHFYIGNFAHGYLQIIASDTLSEDQISLLPRFAKVFEQAYTRFLDLKKAEAQAREAEIEIALERIRSKTMAMQSSKELAEVSALIFDQLKGLGGALISCGVVLCDREPTEQWMSAPIGEMLPSLHIPKDLDIHLANLFKAWENQEELYIELLDENELSNHNRALRTVPEVDAIFEAFPEAVENLPPFQYNYAAPFKQGYILVITTEQYTEDYILPRFAKVFEQTYTRFLDLQKAEAQARESEIQLALERVRARTMAMHRSDELVETASQIFKQLELMGIKLWTFGFNVWVSDQPLTEAWSSSASADIMWKMKVPHDEEPTLIEIYEHRNQNISYYYKELKGEQLQKHIEYMFGLIGETSDEIAKIEVQIPSEFHFYAAYFKDGYLLFVLDHQMPEASDLFPRFAKVFEQTYTRFLDLKKAEAQAKEALIEAALERVRSRSMAMHKSEELVEVATVLHKELGLLDVNEFSDTSIVIFDETNNLQIVWGARTGSEFLEKSVMPLLGDQILQKLYDKWLSQDVFFTVKVGGLTLQKHINFVFPKAERTELEDRVLKNLPDPTYFHCAAFSTGYLELMADKELSDNSAVLLTRFAKVFEQTYTRFLDIQKAEAQTREAKIEAALEKVRSRTMGMQSSDELPEVANLLFLEVQALDIPAWSCGYNILNDDKKSAAAWMSSEGVLQAPFRLRLYGEASFDEMGYFLQSNETMLVQELGGEALQEHYKHMKSFPDLQPTFENIEEKGLSLPTYQINHLCKFTHGFLLFITYEKVEGSHDIFRRFTKVFEQTYTRFLDLKKAEAQAREAQIENALEKVRSRSLAMQNPEELVDVAKLLREEMGALGVEELETSSIYIHDENNGLTQCWFAIKNADNSGKTVTDQMTINLKDTWVGRQMDAFYRSPAKKTSILMQGKNRIEWIHYCEKKSDLFGSSNFYGETIPERTYHMYKFSNGFIGAAAPGGISTESWDLLKRATAVFSFAYTRFRDLQTAEASARAALRQASLDRIRADISSMRHAGDLDRITPLIFNELTTLGIPFIRCGVFIVHEKKEMVEVYLSTPEGKSLAVMNLAFDANELAKRSVNAWKKEEVLIQHWSKADFINYGKLMVSQGQVKDLKTYQGNSAAPDSLHLHFIPFSQGLLYVGSTETLADEQIELTKALAKAFAIAYARYEDFIKLEKAKLEVESAMNELKSTQSQLIHSEKMASLGELTAGIAHEIQNPLNFVNNFSEVSEELVTELKEELIKGDLDEAKVLSNDVIHNLQKIKHHGRRASDIVKGMLQHSRSSNGQKEPTDINALADEYLRLAYHGLRAKDKSFNADFKTALDPGLPKIMVVPQDIGRVMLNLINNAFYAVDKKAKEGLKDYKPLVTVSTKKIPLPGDLSRPDNYRDHFGRAGGGFKEIQITVNDNGPGIPEQVRDKIFQPFFTTKPTGQGTGLGLSLSYDIIKAHGGELKVDSIKDISTEFIITLPQNQ